LQAGAGAGATTCSALGPCRPTGPPTKFELPLEFRRRVPVGRHSQPKTLARNRPTVYPPGPLNPGQLADIGEQGAIRPPKCANRLPSVRVLDSCRGSSEPPGPSWQTEYDEGPVCGVHTRRGIACLAGPSTRTDGIRAFSRVLDSPASCCLRGSEPGSSPDNESDSRLVAPGRDAAAHDVFGTSRPSHEAQSPCFRHVLMR
jgi:hypothetical protein